MQIRIENSPEFTSTILEAWAMEKHQA